MDTTNGGEQLPKRNPIVDWMSTALGHETEEQKANPHRPDGVLFEFKRFGAMTPTEAAQANSDFDRAIEAVKPRPSDLQVANLRMKLARSTGGVTLLEFDYLAGHQGGMPAGTFAILHGAVPVDRAVGLLLDEKRSPEAEIERRQVAFRQQHIAREQEAALQRMQAEERRGEELKRHHRAQAWLSRPHVERTLLRLAHARPQDADLLRAIASALITDIDSEDKLPPGDIDIQPRARPY